MVRFGEKGWEFGGKSGNLVGKSDFWRRKGEKHHYPSDPNADYRSTLEWDLLVEIFSQAPLVSNRNSMRGKRPNPAMENRGFIVCQKNPVFGHSCERSESGHFFLANVKDFHMFQDMFVANLRQTNSIDLHILNFHQTRLPDAISEITNQGILGGTRVGNLLVKHMMNTHTSYIDKNTHQL